MEQKWEAEARLREVFKKYQGITDADIDYLFEQINAAGMSITDELIPFYATYLTLNRHSLEALAGFQQSAENLETAKNGFDDKIEHFTLKMKELLEEQRTDAIDRIEVYTQIRTDVAEDIKRTSDLTKDNLKLELETISRRSIDTAINAAKDGITEHVQDIVSEIGEAVNKSQIDHRALELHKLSENHRRSHNLLMISAAGLIGLSIIATATITHITTRENTQVIANELVEYARKPDAENYLQWLRMYDENHAVFLRTCGASGNQIVEKSGLCTPTIRVSHDVSRVFNGSSVMSTVENWWLSRSSYTIAFITFLTTMAGLIFVPMIINNKYVRWTRRKLKYIYRNRLFYSRN